jgi:hypothetical protein
LRLKINSLVPPFWSQPENSSGSDHRACGIGRTAKVGFFLRAAGGGSRLGHRAEPAMTGRCVYQQIFFTVAFAARRARQTPQQPQFVELGRDRWRAMAMPRALAAAPLSGNSRATRSVC